MKLKRIERWVAGLLAVVLLAACATVDPTQDGGYRVSQAWQRNEPVPLLRPVYGKALTTETAYRIQRQALEQLLQGRYPDGYKAGLTNLAAQQAYGATEPFAGVLLPASGVRRAEDGFRVELRQYRRAFAEVEIGFRLSQTIRHPLPDVNALKALVVEVVPVIELPDLAHTGSGQWHVLDLIATNAGSRLYIEGAARAPSVVDPNTVSITLYRDGEPLTQGTAFDVVGDQWQVLLWLVNRTVASGWAIEPRQLLITGALGKPVPLERGLYVADYGRFGRVEFWVD